MEDEDDDDGENDTVANTSTSVSYPNALNCSGESSKDGQTATISAKIPKSHQRRDEPESNTSDVRMARNALEASRLNNSSSQWLHSSSSRSF